VRLYEVYARDEEPRDVAALAGGAAARRDGDGWVTERAGAPALRVVFFREDAAVEAAAALGSGAGEAAERLRAARGRYAIETVGARSSPAATLAAAELAAAIAAASDGLVADPSAGLLLSVAEARAIAAAGGRIPVDGLVRVHLLDGPGGAWIHTHGAEKLGVSEIEAFDVDPQVGAAVAAAMTQVLLAWVARGRCPDAIPPDVAAPAGAAVRLVPAAVGPTRPAWAVCGTGAPGVALVDPTGADVSPAFGGRSAAMRSFEERARAIFVAEVLGARLAPRRGALPPGVRLFAKVAVESEEHGPSGAMEMTWVEILRVEPDRLCGRADELSAEPLDLKPEQILGLAAFREDWAPLSDEELSQALAV
jgi:hypothetical protein